MAASGTTAAPGGVPVRQRVGAARVGVVAWSFVGAVLAVAIVVGALAAVAEIMLPLTFAVVLAVVFKPLVESLERRGLNPTLGSAVVLVLLLVTAVVVVLGTVRGVVDQADELGAVADEAVAAVGGFLDARGVDEAMLETVRGKIEAAGPMIAQGVATSLVAGVDTLLGLVAGAVLGTMLLYYLLKDGSLLRSTVVALATPRAREGVDDFVGDACRQLREYGKGRTVLSLATAVVVAVAALLLGLPLVATIAVVNFIGGYIPYVGAFLGGGLAVIVALGDSGAGAALIMLGVVLASNVLLENLLEPRVMGSALDVHPMMVLLVTGLGGLLGGIVGLLLAVPAYTIVRSAAVRLWRVRPGAVA